MRSRPTCLRKTGAPWPVCVTRNPAATLPTQLFTPTYYLCAAHQSPVVTVSHGGAVGMGALGGREVTGLVPNHFVIVILPKPCSSIFTHMLALARHPRRPEPKHRLGLALVNTGRRRHRCSSNSQFAYNCTRNQGTARANISLRSSVHWTLSWWYLQA